MLSFPPSCVNEGDKYNGTLSDCVKELYATSKHTHEAGTVWDYNESHLQIIGAVLEKIYNKDIDEVLSDALKRYGMTDSYWMSGKNPNLAADLVATGTDYGTFLKHYYNYDYLTPDFINLMEGAYNVQPMVKPTDIGEILMLFLGHYGHTLWYECPLAVTSVPHMRAECIQNSVHSCPGIYGFWPVIDRHKDYWFQVVVYGEAVVGCIVSMFFRLTVKPFIDLAMLEEEILPNVTMPDYKQILEQQDKYLKDKKLRNALETLLGDPMAGRNKLDF